MSETVGRRRLSADDWAEAALTAIAEGGLAAVAVEKLAARLGTTKGSFYWHFRNREALLQAALHRWEHQHTEAIIALVEQSPEPADRLRRLFTLVTDHTQAQPENRIEVALVASAAEPMVAASLGRVTERRIGYVADLYIQRGMDPVQARQRALLAYSAWLGHTQLVHTVPQALPRGADQQPYLEHVLDTLL
jgi:AcrR family transcriptional regulator